MKRVAVLLTMVVAVLVNPVLPRTVWAIATCCHQSLSLTAPQRLDFCSPAAAGSVQPGQMQIEAPNCCSAKAIAVSTHLPVAIPVNLSELPVDWCLPTADLRAATPPQLAYANASSRGECHAHSPPATADPLYLVHARLNL